MNTRVRRSIPGIQYALLGLMYGLFTTAPAVADDIEIYTGSISSSSAFSASANVLFIVDTSGSMDAIVMQATGVYDPAVTYPGCFDTNTLYTDINLGGSAGVNGYCTGAWGYDLGSRPKFSESVFVCQTGNNAIATEGFYTDRVGQWRSWNSGTGSYRWRGISNRASKFFDKVECEADGGIHGEGGAALYAANNGGTGFSTNAGSEINWAGRSSETVHHGNYLNFLVSNPPVEKTRLEVMRDALTELVNTTSGINIGLMRFDVDANGGMVVTPMGLIDTTRPAFINELNQMWHEGATPLSETLYEAALYFQGKEVDYGNGSEAGLPNPLPDVAMPSHPDSRQPSGGARYKSPITSECQKNYIVLLSDGEPVNDTGIETSSARRSRIGLSGGCSGNCLDEIAFTLASNDQSTSISEDQFVSTYTIGLQLDHPLLKSTAQASKNASGQGEYYIAENANELSNAFNNIVRQVLESESTFSSPAVSVNAYNRSTHLNDLYFTLFKPTGNPHWPGNFKKYKLLSKVDTADVDGDGNTTEKIPYVADATFGEAIDAGTGFFANGTRSFWTPPPTNDGPLVTIGGVVQHLFPGRWVLTNSQGYSGGAGVGVPLTPDLTHSDNFLDKSNALITDAMLNTAAELPYDAPTPYRESLLDWARGFDVRDLDQDGDIWDARQEMGDPLHAQPALVQYGEYAFDSDGDGINDPDLVGYVATNDGYLHAVESIIGWELWSFIPQELLPNLTVNFKDESTSPKSYGLDGDVVAWINDIDNDGAINGSDHVYLYVGMRRGGSNIYSLDVTNRYAPKLRWVIQGGIGDYAELGQTWSTVNVETLKLGGSEKTVLVFGGGYDPDQDTATVRTPDGIGRGVFIADAETGQLLWRAGPDAGANLQLTEMKYSVPARVKPIDIDGNGFIDRMYVGDMGGQIFRFDITESDTSTDLSTLISGGRIADLAEDASITDARRFYYSPDVSLIVEEGQAPYLALVASSGFRAHPLNADVHDKIYMIRENDIYNVPSPYVTVTESDLFDTTTNAIGETDGAAQQALITALGSAKGWYIDLDESGWIGEKGLAEPLILGGVAIVSTYIPQNLAVAGASVCAPQAGTGSVYYLNVTDGTPTFNLAGTVDKKREDRRTFLKRSGIPPSPSVIVTEDGPVTICIGTECNKAELNLDLQKMYWYEVEQ